MFRFETCVRRRHRHVKDTKGSVDHALQPERKLGQENALRVIRPKGATHTYISAIFSAKYRKSEVSKSLAMREGSRASSRFSPQGELPGPEARA
jgi:hypothetical protein